MKLFIRDDDTSYFTKVSELEEAYKDIWDFGPINLAIIPYAVETFKQGILGSQHQNQVEFFIGENLELVDYLKLKIQEGKINIMLHGYNHLYRQDIGGKVNYPFGIPEFLYTENQYEKIRKGKVALESLFNVEIKWFIPPSNSLKLETIEVCDLLGLNIPLVFNLKYRFLNVLFSNPLIFFVNRFNKIFSRNIPLRFNNHCEILCTSFTSVTNFKNLMKYVDNEVIATHYWEINRHPKIREEIFKELKRFNFKLNSMNEII